MFEIKVEQRIGRVPVTILRLLGSFDTAATKIFEDKTDELIERGSENFLLDLSALTFLSSIGIRSITTLYYELHPEISGEEKGSILKGIRSGEYTAPHLKLLKPPSNIKRVLETTGLDLVLETYTNEGKAIEAF